MKIGVLSDTHGMLRPQALSALAGCEAILHGGDINRQEILDELARIAPVHVVRGNNDKAWAERIPMFLDFELAGLRVYMTHKKKDLPADLSAYDLVVYGHSHKYEESRRGKTLLLNPGSCGPRRFNQAITLAVLEVEHGNIAVRRVDIPHTGEAVDISKAVDLKAQIETVMRETQRGRGPGEIAQRHGWDAALVAQIARLYVTHPGVTADGIMGKMGI
ncbi:MAG: metallophosphoesterase family protein [Clostridia bacterium]|nr:metallophosphoesterase family protein [Clostridia bacterium]